MALGLHQKLLELGYLELKAQLGLLQELPGEYKAALGDPGLDDEERQALVHLGQAVGRVMPRIRRFPENLFQEIYNDASWRDRPSGLIFGICEIWREQHEGSGKGWIQSLRAPGLPADHAGEVTTLLATDEPARFLTASVDRSVKVWDPRTASVRLTLSGHTGEVRACAFTRNGLGAVSVSDDRSVRIWELTHGKEVACLRGHAAAVEVCAASRDGRWVVSGSRDLMLKIWDAAARQEVASCVGHTDQISVLRLTPDERQVVSGSFDQTLALWDLETGQRRMVFTGHAGRVLDCCFADGGQTLVSVSEDRTVRLWNLRTGAETGQLTGHVSQVRACTVLADGQRVVTDIYLTDTRLQRLAILRDMFIAGDSTGLVHVVHLK
ncbi:MAG: WD40 repeat domain-containing protein [Candidatus Riflebacteria bacterium]|nr:WD40 repeat domain-containing protein [Candidatus Riflebacteria bacterium]